MGRCRDANLCVGTPAALFGGCLVQEAEKQFFLVQLCCECVHPFTHPSICFCSELRGTAELANHRSISVLLWPSGDLRCMASCDPDSFLLSPPAPPHWHSGTPSERGREGWKRGQEEERGQSETGKEGALTRSWKWIIVAGEGRRRRLL